MTTVSTLDTTSIYGHQQPSSITTSLSMAYSSSSNVAPSSVGIINTTMSATMTEGYSFPTMPVVIAIPRTVTLQAVREQLNQGMNGSSRVLDQMTKEKNNAKHFKISSESELSPSKDVSPSLGAVGQRPVEQATHKEEEIGEAKPDPVTTVELVSDGEDVLELCTITKPPSTDEQTPIDAISQPYESLSRPQTIVQNYKCDYLSEPATSSSPSSRSRNSLPPSIPNHLVTQPTQSIIIEVA